MDIARKFGRIGTVLLPLTLLGVFFKYLHPLNSILHGIEGWAMNQLLDIRIRIAKRDIQMRYYLLMLWVRHKLGKT